MCCSTNYLKRDIIFLTRNIIFLTRDIIFLMSSQTCAFYYSPCLVGLGLETSRAGSVPERARLGSSIPRACEKGSSRLVNHILILIVALFGELTLYKFKI
jgi:hypothetical protein